MVVFHPFSLLRVGSVVAVMNAVMHLQVPPKGGNLFTSWKTSDFQNEINCSVLLTESSFDLRDTIPACKIVCLSETRKHASVAFGALATLTRIFVSILVLWLYWHGYISQFYCVGCTDMNISVHFSALATLALIFLSVLVRWLHWHEYFCPF